MTRTASPKNTPNGIEVAPTKRKFVSVSALILIFGSHFNKISFYVYGIS